MGGANWAALPSDIFYILIAEHVTFTDLELLADVCTAWRSFIRTTVFDPSTRLKTLAYGHGDRSKTSSFRPSIEYITDRVFLNNAVLKRVNLLKPGTKVHQLFTQTCITEPQEEVLYAQVREDTFLKRVMGGEVAGDESSISLQMDPLFEPAVEWPVAVRVRYKYTYADLVELEPEMSDHEDEEDMPDDMVECESDNCVWRKTRKSARRGDPSYVPFNPENYNFKSLHRACSWHSCHRGCCPCVRTPVKDPEAHYLVVAFKLYGHGSDTWLVDRYALVADLMLALEEQLEHLWKWEEKLTVPAIHLSVNPLGWLDVKLDIKLLASADDACIYMPGCASGQDFPSPVQEEEERGKDNGEEEEDQKEEEEEEEDLEGDSEYWTDEMWSSGEDDELRESLKETVKSLFGETETIRSDSPLKYSKLEDAEAFFPKRMFDERLWLRHTDDPYEGSCFS